MPIAIASGALRHEIDEVVNAAGLAPLFAAIVAAGDTPESKPSPEPYRLAFRRLQEHAGGTLDPQRCVAIEDSRWGLESARGAGLRCVAVTNSYPAHELAGAELVVHGLHDLSLEQLDRLSLGNNEAIPVVRALQRRLLQLAGLRARVEQGQSVDAVMTSMGKALFWKDKALMQQLLSAWSAERLAAMLERSSSLERTIIFSDEPPVAALEEELVTIARAAQRRR